MPDTMPLFDTVELSHLRATVKRRLGKVRAHEMKQKTAYGDWKRINPRVQYGVLDCDTEEELMAALEELNRDVQRLINIKGMERAKRTLRRHRQAKRREEARKRYKGWLLSVLDADADAYKEAPDRMRYTGGPDGGQEPRSMTDWLDLQARKQIPERAAEKKRQIREDCDLPEGARLI